MPIKIAAKPGYHSKKFGRRKHPDGSDIPRHNTRRMNKVEELGRVDAERADTRRGARNLKDEKKRIVRELKAKGGQAGPKRKFGGGRNDEEKQQPRTGRAHRGIGAKPGKLKDAVEWERWKIERKKQSEKPVKPLGRIKKIGPKPGSMDYFLQETMKPGYKGDRGYNSGGKVSPATHKRNKESAKVFKLMKGKPKLAKRGWK